MAIVPNVIEEIDKGDDAGGAGGAGTGTTLFSPSTVKDYQKMYADMLGGKDKDSAKDKWNDFAMLGFAIAAGQDPNALTNIAQGLLDGTKMMKEDRSIEQARQDKFTMMAIQAADADRRAAIAAGASTAAANLKYNRDVKLIDQRAGIATDTATNLAKTTAERDKLKADALIEAARIKRLGETYLGTEQGKITAGMYTKILNNDMFTDSTRYPAFVKAVGQTQADAFANALNLPQGQFGSAGVGKGVAGTGGGLTRFTARANANKGDGK